MSGNARPGWLALAATVRGPSHEAGKTPCQDAVWLQASEDGSFVAAVADGLGSEPLSHEGSALATRTMVEFLTAAGAPGERPSSARECRELFQRGLAEVLARLARRASESSVPIEALGCTLIAVYGTPHWLAAMQLGDGFAVVRSAYRRAGIETIDPRNTPTPDTGASVESVRSRPELAAYEILFQPMKGQYSNEVIPITYPDAANHLCAALVSDPPRFICLSTDGLEDIALLRRPNRRFVAGATFFPSFERSIPFGLTPEVANSQLSTYLDSPGVRERSDDDKGLLVLMRQSPCEALRRKLGMLGQRPAKVATGSKDQKDPRGSARPQPEAVSASGATLEDHGWADSRGVRLPELPERS